jgi:hypothetical protein
MDAGEMTRWVKSDDFGILADVGYYPERDRNSDQPGIARTQGCGGRRNPRLRSDLP